MRRWFAIPGICALIDVRLRRLQPIATPTLPWVIGLFLWIILGTVVVAPEQLFDRLIWGMSLLASMAGVLFQINTLSFAYHSVLWIFFGLVGAWCSAIRYHRPEFDVRLTWRDLGIIVTICTIYVGVVLPVFLRLKGYI
ncbi:MAG TPA: hypothetical protein VGC42_23185 [Kofleriaceae bacterium]